MRHQDAIVATSELERFLADQPRDPEVCHPDPWISWRPSTRLPSATRAKFFEIWKRSTARSR